MKKHSIFLILFIIICVSNSEKIFSQKTRENEKTSKIAYSEKIYLQLNSTVFINDQTIWFKAIVTNTNQIQTTFSKILHVELIDFDKRIIDQKLLKLENGITSNSFELDEALPPGKYMIRAYTKWNTNFDNDFITRQYINIYKSRKPKEENSPIRDVVLTENPNKHLEISGNLFPKKINIKHKRKLVLRLDLDGIKDSIIIKKDKKNGYNFKYILPKGVVKTKLILQLDSIKLNNNNLGFLHSYSKTIITNKNFIDLQFFPEGGKLINGLKSVVAFKALDYKNKGLQIKGIIIDQNGVKITDFESNKLGMGIFHIHSNNRKTYYAEILVAGIKNKYALPKIHDKGYVLNVNTYKEKIRLEITSNFSKIDSLFIKVASRGLVYHTIKSISKNAKLKLAIYKDSLPEGIITITVFDKENRPICERLIFNYKEKNNRIKITTKNDKQRYIQRDKIIFDINTKNENDNSPLKTNTSILVVNKKQMAKMQGDRQNILSYFLLQSELKGNIEQPNYYFDTKNKYRFYAIDILLLTQGWRNYSYKPTNDSLLFKVPPEENLQISGKIKKYLKKKKKRRKPIEVTLLATGKNYNQIQANSVDSLGQFNFNLKDNYDENLEYLIQTKNHRGVKDNYTMDIEKFISPKINYKKEIEVELADSYKTYVSENIKRKIKENPFNAYDGISLAEVLIKTKRLTPEQEKMKEEHGAPDIIIENKELISKKKKWSYGLYSILMFSYPDDVEVERVAVNFNGGFLYASVHGADFTIIIVDGTPVKIEDYNIIGDLPTEEIKSIDIVKNPKNPKQYEIDIFGESGIFTLSNGIMQVSIININTYSKKGLLGVRKTNGILINTLPTFAPKKEFYTPKHEKLNKIDWEIPDLRSVVYWNPDIKINDKGEAKIEFYNADNIDDMLVIIESISKNGKLGYYETTYKVNKRLVK